MISRDEEASPLEKRPLKNQDGLFDELYSELKLIARSQMAGQKVGHTLQPTALINEAYLKMKASSSAGQWQDKKHFFCTVSKVMRQILVDSARAKASRKRGGNLIKVELHECDAIQIEPQYDLLALDEALAKYESVSADKSRLVQLRYFTGLSLAEAAEVLEISRATAHNYWVYSKAWLQRELTT